MYDGEWKNGKKDGFGKYETIDKSIYEGEWVNDKFEGKVLKCIILGENTSCRWRLL